MIDEAGPRLMSVAGAAPRTPVEHQFPTVASSPDHRLKFGITSWRRALRSMIGAFGCVGWYAQAVVELRPDVLLGDGAIVPLGYSHHAVAIFELPDHARPFSGPEPDRV